MLTYEDEIKLTTRPNMVQMRAICLGRQMVSERMGEIEKLKGKNLPENFAEKMDLELANRPELLAHFLAMEEMFDQLEHLTTFERAKKLIEFAMMPESWLYDYALSRGWLDIKKPLW